MAVDFHREFEVALATVDIRVGGAVIDGTSFELGGERGGRVRVPEIGASAVGGEDFRVPPTQFVDDLASELTRCPQHERPGSLATGVGDHGVSLWPPVMSKKAPTLLSVTSSLYWVSVRRVVRKFATSRRSPKQQPW